MLGVWKNTVLATWSHLPFTSQVGNNTDVEGDFCLLEVFTWEAANRGLNTVF